MAQGTFVQALRKEAALSGTFMKGRSLMLNGAVLSIEDSGSRFSKNVTVEGSVRGSRGDLYKTHVALDMDEHEVIDYDCDCPAAYRYPGMNKVLQAAGRVIRTSEDVGIVALLDDRFLNGAYQQLFPREWEEYEVVTADRVARRVERFWDEWL